MSDAAEQAAAKLRELADERDGLVNARTKESTAADARAFLETARARSGSLGALVVGGHAVGQSLDDVLRAFLLTDPRLEAWLVEQAGEFAETTEKERASRLHKAETEISKVTNELREARRIDAVAAAEAEIEAQFGGVAA